MLNFLPITLDRRGEIHPLLYGAGRQGCEYSFANLLFWMSAFTDYTTVGGFVCVRMKSKQGERFLFPAGVGDPTAAIELLRRDAAERGVPFQMVGVTKNDRRLLEMFYPGRFLFTVLRDMSDYTYPVEQLAELAGKKLQAKRNHINHFIAEHPDWRTEPISEGNVELCRRCAQKWFLAHGESDGEREHGILETALMNMQTLGMEGLLLLEGDEPLAFSLGNRITEKVFDVNFEKADADVHGSFAVINREMARMVRSRYPEVTLLNREDDMGLPGLRKAKESYQPILLEKYSAVWEEK